ncbi:protein disulfide-isomerase precursor [Metarhizium acridum]|nr:protein disulfide-isomerase precursor [Metarhizium acridum]
MQHKRIAFGLLAAFASLASAEDKSDVHQLTEKTFNDFVEANPLVLAEFFAPWCGHCKALAPEYEEAATTLKEKKIKLAKIDCTEEAELCQKHGVEGYPTLKVFRGAENAAPYNGQRKAAAITSYMVKQSLPAVSALTKDTLEEFKTADKVVVVAYFAADDKASNETFTKVADKLRDNYLFGGVNDAAVAEAEGVKFPSIVLYKSFDEGKNTYTEKFEAEAIEKFAKTAATPLIGEVGPETYADYMSAGIPLAYIFAETQEERDALSKDLKPVAEKYKGKINFATIDAKAFGAHAGNLNLETDKFPCLRHPPYSGKIEPSVKSEPIPENQDDPVTIIVAKNYEQIVLDDKKDVLVEFYAPWCGHCKALAPKYDQLGEAYKKSEFKDKVVIAKVDATANDVPDDISGFPTIKLFAAGKKDSPFTYSGARTVEDLIEFIKENGKHKAAVSFKEESTEEAAPAASEKAEKDKEDKTEKAEEKKDEDHDEL